MIIDESFLMLTSYQFFYIINFLIVKELTI